WRRAKGGVVRPEAEARSGPPFSMCSAAWLRYIVDSGDSGTLSSLAFTHLVYRKIEFRVGWVCLFGMARVHLRPGFCDSGRRWDGHSTRWNHCIATRRGIEQQLGIELRRVGLFLDVRADIYSAE